MKLNIVPARTGLEWVRQGARVFWRQPLALASLFFMTTAAMSLLSLIPLIGPFVALALLPTATLVMMVAAAEASQGRFPTPALMLVAFRTGRDQMRAMWQLGMLYAVGFILVLGIASLVDGGQFAASYFGFDPVTMEEARDNLPFQNAMLLVSVLYLPLSLLFWHAPGLVHWHHVPPVKALFFSAVACVRNWKAFVVYGIAWIGVFLVAGVAVSIVVTLLAVLGLGTGAAGAIMVATALMLAAMFFSSVVFSFRDNFTRPDDMPPPADAPLVP